MKKYSLELNNQELIYINDTLSHNYNVHSRKISLDFNGNILNASEDEMMYLKNLIGDYLMYVGFDPDDKPNQDGLILEILIDKISSIIKPNGIINKALDYFRKKSNTTNFIKEFSVTENDKNGIRRRLAVGPDVCVILNEEKKSIVTTYRN